MTWTLAVWLSVWHSPSCSVSISFSEIGTGAIFSIFSPPGSKILNLLNSISWLISFLQIALVRCCCCWSCQVCCMPHTHFVEHWYQTWTLDLCFVFCPANTFTWVLSSPCLVDFCGKPSTDHKSSSLLGSPTDPAKSPSVHCDRNTLTSKQQQWTYLWCPSIHHHHLLPLDQKELRVLPFPQS